MGKVCNVVDLPEIVCNVADIPRERSAMLQSFRERSARGMVCDTTPESLVLPVHGNPYFSPRCMDEFRFNDIT